jgi:hypothetical protein
MSTVSAQFTRLEHDGTSLVFVPAGHVEVSLDASDSMIWIYVDGEVVVSIHLPICSEAEAEQYGERHYLEITPHRSSLEWDEGPSVKVRPTEEQP